MLLEIGELRRVLGEDHVGRRGAAFRQDLGGDDETVAVSQLHADSGLPLEGGDEQARELRVLAVVDDERASAATASSEEGGEDDERCQLSLHRGYTATVPSTTSSTRSPAAGTTWSNVLAAMVVSFPPGSAKRTSVSAPW